MFGATLTERIEGALHAKLTKSEEKNNVKCTIGRLCPGPYDFSTKVSLKAKMHCSVCVQHDNVTI